MFNLSPPVKESYNIGFLGGASPQEKYLKIAERVGELIAKSGNVLINGGLSGVMEYAAKGANEAGGIVVGILPGYDHRESNKYTTIPIPTGIGFARNFLIIRACHSLIAIDGSNGTISESSFAISEGKSVISLDSIELKPKRKWEGTFIVASSPEDAVEKAIIEAEKMSHKNIKKGTSLNE